MLKVLTDNSWLLGARGVFGIIFGLMAFTFSTMAVTTLVILFGAYALADGLIAIFIGFLDFGDGNRWWELIAEGALGVVVGGLAYFSPDHALVYIASWAIITGVLEIIEAVRLRREVPDEWWLIMAGLCSILLGLLLIFQPQSNILTTPWLLAGYALGFGVFLLGLTYKLQRQTGD